MSSVEGLRDAFENEHQRRMVAEEENRLLMHRWKDDKTEMSVMNQIIEKQKKALDGLGGTVIVRESPSRPVKTADFLTDLDKELEIDKERRRTARAEQRADDLDELLNKAIRELSASKAENAQLHRALAESDRELSDTRQTRSRDIDLLVREIDILSTDQKTHMIAKDVEIERLRDALRESQHGHNNNNSSLHHSMVGGSSTHSDTSTANRISQLDPTKRLDVIEKLQNCVSEKNVEILNLYRQTKELRKQVGILQDNFIGKLKLEGEREEALHGLILSKTREIDDMQAMCADLRLKYNQLQKLQLSAWEDSNGAGGALHLPLPHYDDLSGSTASAPSSSRSATAAVAALLLSSPASEGTPRGTPGGGGGGTTPTTTAPTPSSAIHTTTIGSSAVNLPLHHSMSPLLDASGRAWQPSSTSAALPTTTTSTHHTPTVNHIRPSTGSGYNMNDVINNNTRHSPTTMTSSSRFSAMSDKDSYSLSSSPLSPPIPLPHHNHDTMDNMTALHTSDLGPNYFPRRSTSPIGPTTTQAQQQATTTHHRPPTPQQPHHGRSSSPLLVPSLASTGGGGGGGGVSGLSGPFRRRSTGSNHSPTTSSGGSGGGGGGRGHRKKQVFDLSQPSSSSRLFHNTTTTTKPTPTISFSNSNTSKSVRVRRTAPANSKTPASGGGRRGVWGLGGGEGGAGGGGGEEVGGASSSTGSVTTTNSTTNRSLEKLSGVGLGSPMGMGMGMGGGGGLNGTGTGGVGGSSLSHHGNGRKGLSLSWDSVEHGVGSGSSGNGVGGGSGVSGKRSALSKKAWGDSSTSEFLGNKKVTTPSPSAWDPQRKGVGAGGGGGGGGLSTSPPPHPSVSTPLMGSSSATLTTDHRGGGGGDLQHGKRYDFKSAAAPTMVGRSVSRDRGSSSSSRRGSSANGQYGSSSSRLRRGGGGGGREPTTTTDSIEGLQVQFEQKRTARIKEQDTLSLDHNNTFIKSNNPSTTNHTAVTAGLRRSVSVGPTRHVIELY